jgi:D-sedoheptulose 7-phosphate isomerase
MRHGRQHSKVPQSVRYSAISLNVAADGRSEEEMLTQRNYDRAPAATIALTTDSSVLAAITDDRAFKRQILLLGCPGAALMANSTVARRRTSCERLQRAGNSSMIIGFTGGIGGEMATHCGLCLHALSDLTPLMWQIRITVGHAIGGLVEENLVLPTSAPQ